MVITNHTRSIKEGLAQDHQVKKDIEVRVIKIEIVLEVAIEMIDIDIDALDLARIILIDIEDIKGLDLPQGIDHRIEIVQNLHILVEGMQKSLRWLIR